MAAIALLPVTPVSARSIEMPSMPMADALLALARIGGRNILFAPENVAGLQARAVRAGSFGQALRQITGDAPLRAVPGPGGAVALVPSVKSAAARPHRAVVHHALPREEDTSGFILVNGADNRDTAPAYSGALAIQSTITAGDARRLPDRTLAETLGRVPGVLTLSTSLEGNLGGIDHAARAEGDFIALRGLHDGYVETRIDGITVPQSLPYNRGAELGLLPADGFTSVSVIKVLGPDRAGNADAGLIDIANPVPRDPAVQGLHLHMSGGLDQRALDYGQDGGSLGGGFAWAGHLVDDRIAIAIGADYTRRVFANVEQTYQGGNLEYAITDAAGQSAPGLDPARNLLLTSLNAQVTRGISRDINLHGGLDFDAGDRLTLFARFSYANEHIRQDIFQIGFQGGRDPSYVERDPIGGGLYLTRSVKSEMHYWYETNPENSGLVLGQIGARWQGDRTRITARFFAASGWTGRPDHLEISFWDPQGSQLDGGLVLRQQGIFPVPVLTARDRALDDALFTFPVHDKGENQGQSSRDTRFGGDIAIRRQVETGALQAWEAGIEALASRRSQWMRNLTYSDTYPDGTTLGQSGLARGSLQPLLAGVYDYNVPLIDDDRLVSLLRHSTPDPLTPDGFNGNTVFGHEQRAAAHASARFRWGSFEWEPGLRLQVVHIANRYWLSGNDGVPLDGIAYGWNWGTRTYGAVLPSMMARWKPTDRIMVQAGIWSSQTQPAPYQLAGGASVEEQADGTRIVEQGNPRLKAVNAMNADIAVEWRGKAGASLSMGGFAKRLDHYLYDMGSSFGESTGPTEGSVQVIEPHNGGHADIWGLELSARWPLSTIQSWLAGWTLGGEATLLRSRVHLNVPQLDPVERAQYAPGHDATLRLAYAGHRLSMDAAMNWVGAYVQQYGLFGTSLGVGSTLDGSALDDWVRPSRRLDFSIGYEIGRRATLRLMVRNALDDVAYRATLGRHSDAVPETIVSGRLFGLHFDRSL